jgi:hypothetical protein
MTAKNKLWDDLASSAKEQLKINEKILKNDQDISRHMNELSQ